MKLDKVKKFWHSIVFQGSLKYWEERYKAGGNSGSGSYNRLAEFKADIINGFIKQYDIMAAIEFGCGDGNVLSLIHYPKYIGLDVSKTAIMSCIRKFTEDKSKSFLLYDPLCFQDNCKLFSAELTLSLDVIFHLVEDQIYYKYMNDLFSASEKYVIIYSSNFEEKHIHHMRQRKFTSWVEANEPEWQLINFIKNKYPYDSSNPDTSIADFYFYKKQQVNDRLGIKRNSG